MRLFKKWVASASFIGVTAMSGIAGCGGGFNLFPVSDDVALGRQIDAEIRANPSQYPILNNAQATSYLQNMVNRIVQSDDVKYRGQFPYQVTIINDAKTVNAFATPGGYIYVYTGLIKMLDNEASMAGVLGHEIAHSEERHGTEAMSKQYGAQILLSVLLGNNASQLTEIAGNLVTGLAILKNSRDAENEADELSFRYLQDTQWYPGGAALFFQKLENQGGGNVEFLSTHPNPENRVAKMQQRLQSIGYAGSPSESSLGTSSYQNFKRMVP